MQSDGFRGLMVVTAVVVLTCASAMAADYPNNMPDQPLSAIQSEMSFLIQLEPNDKIQVQGSFNGSNTGCGIYVHDVGTGQQVFKKAHNLHANPEQFSVELKAPAGKKAAYVVSIWTFIGGPPHVDLPEGWHQVGPDKGTFSVIPGQALYTVQGSQHGPTTVKFSVTQE